MNQPNDRWTLDRRELIAAGGATMAATLLSVAHGAAPSWVPESQTQAIADWSIDDMWTGYPRCHEAIGYGRARPRKMLAAADPVDEQFVT